MQIKKYYLKTSNRRLAVPFWIATWLLMDRLKAPEWLYGIYWFLVILCVVCFIYNLCYYEEIQVDAQDILKSWKESEIKSER